MTLERQIGRKTVKTEIASDQGLDRHSTKMKQCLNMGLKTIAELMIELPEQNGYAEPFSC